MNDNNLFQTLKVCDAKHDSVMALISALQKNFDTIEIERKKDLERIYEKLEKFGDRLPSWAVAIGTIGSMIIGILITKIIGH